MYFFDTNYKIVELYDIIKIKRCIEKYKYKPLFNKTYIIPYKLLIYYIENGFINRLIDADSLISKYFKYYFIKCSHDDIIYIINHKYLKLDKNILFEIAFINNDIENVIFLNEKYNILTYKYLTYNKICWILFNMSVEFFKYISKKINIDFIYEDRYKCLIIGNYNIFKILINKDNYLTFDDIDNYLNYPRNNSYNINSVKLICTKFRNEISNLLKNNDVYITRDLFKPVNFYILSLKNLKWMYDYIESLNLKNIEEIKQDVFYIYLNHSNEKIFDFLYRPNYEISQRHYIRFCANSYINRVKKFYKKEFMKNIKFYISNKEVLTYLCLMDKTYINLITIYKDDIKKAIYNEYMILNKLCNKLDKYVRLYIASFL